MTDTQTVRFELLGFQRMRDAGRLKALAVVEIEIAGVVVVLQGVQVMAEPSGGMAVRPPHHRAADGQLRPSVGLPKALRDALAAEVLAAVTGATAD